MNQVPSEVLPNDSALISSLPRSYSVKQVAQFLHCEVKTVESELTLGTLPGIQFGKEWVIPEEIFISYLNALAISQTHERLMVQQGFTTNQIHPIAHSLPGAAQKNATYGTRTLISEEELIQLSGIVHNDEVASHGKPDGRRQRGAASDLWKNHV